MQLQSSQSSDSLVRDPYRWAVLAAGAFATLAYAAFQIGLPVLAPGLRARYDLSLTEVGVLLSAVPVGAVSTVFIWGLAADRLGERSTLVIGLLVCSASVAGTAYSSSFAVTLVLIAAAGASGACVNASGGRALMQWFGREERGLALSLRQTAVPMGGFVAALILPRVELLGGVDAALLTLAGFCAAGALVGALVFREPPVVPHEQALDSVLRDGRLWRLCIGSSLYVFPQTVMIGFAVLFLHDARGLSVSAGAHALGAIYLLASFGRAITGRWSDRLGARVVPLRWMGLAIALGLLLVSVLTRAPLGLLIPTIIAAGAVSMSWNGLPITAAAEFGGRLRSGAAIGLQQTTIAIVTAVAPVVFAATVASTSWSVGFVLAALVAVAGWRLLGPISEARPAIASPPADVTPSGTTA